MNIKATITQIKNLLKTNQKTWLSQTEEGLNFFNLIDSNA